jgi:3-oxoacyl-[acyl-carrier-protein] synthase II
MGAVTPLGCGWNTFWDAARAGQCGIGRIERFDPAPSCPARLAGHVRGFDPDPYIDRKDRKRMDRFTQYAVVAAAQAMEDAGLAGNAGRNPYPPERLGVAFSSGVGGVETFEEQHTRFLERGPEWVSPFFVPMMIGNMAAGNIAIMFNAKGPSTCQVTACAASAHSIADAFRLIAEGRAEAMIAGGAEAAITPLTIAGFANMQALSTSDDPDAAPRPFDRRRDGFVMGEGAGALVLESLDSALARGARVYAEIAGCGFSTDAHHITSPAPGGEGAARAMTEAMRDASVAPQDIDYVNAHGTGTPYNDSTETQAIKTALGEHAHRVAISSTKSMIGHLLGAAGAVEAIACIGAIIDGFVHPTIHYAQPDPECDLDYVPNHGRTLEVRTAISNSLGFGGHNCCLVFRRWDEPPANPIRLLPHREPFVLVDEIVSAEPGVQAVGIKQVRPDEFWAPGHFPGHPVMPGVLIVEAMAQVGAVALFLGMPQPDGNVLPLFAGANNVRFRRQVCPGDTLTIETRILQSWRNFGRAHSTARLPDGVLAAEAELLFALGEAECKPNPDVLSAEKKPR